MNVRNRFLIIAPFLYSAGLHGEEYIDDQVVVVGQQPSYLHHLDSVLPVTRIDVTDASSSGSTADVFSLAPQISLNGQGGLLQTISVRGLSRWRIQTMVEGVPIHTERRAGNAAEFIPPSMIGGAYVLPGAASTQLGSGALGGGVDVQLAATLDTQLSATFGDQQDYRSVSAAGGKPLADHDLYWGVSTRHANRGEDGLDQTLENGFEQTAGWVRHVSDTQPIKDALLIVSRANNAGKASADLPTERVTEYPANDHWLAKMDFDWLNARVYAHQVDLETEITRPGRRVNHLRNRALGWGLSIGDAFAQDKWLFNWRFSLDARSAVKAQERERDNSGQQVFQRVNLDGEQRAWSLALDGVRNWDAYEFAAGARLELMGQKADSIESSDLSDSNVSGFLAFKKHWSDTWSSGIYVSSAYRVPTLTERYFNGSTPRGTTLGDTGLDTEHARNIQLDMHYRDDGHGISVSVFRQKIDNYIERLALSENLQQYVNLGDVTIDGVTYQGRWNGFSHGYVQMNGQWLWGEDNNGQPINDVSPHQHSLKFGYESDRIELWLNTQYRSRHTRVGSSELAIGSAVFFGAGLRKMYSDGLSISVLLHNLTDRDYPVSTDDLSPLAMGRDIQLSLSYVF